MTVGCLAVLTREANVRTAPSLSGDFPGEGSIVHRSKQGMVFCIEALVTGDIPEGSVSSLWAQISPVNHSGECLQGEARYVYAELLRPLGKEARYR